MDGGESEDESDAWNGWEMEEDSSSDSDESEGWINVSDDEQQLEFSDSDDEKEKETGIEVPQEKKPSVLATTKVLELLA
jgi:protein SDA1